MKKCNKIINLAIEGCKLNEIALELDISTSTVKRCLKNSEEYKSFKEQRKLNIFNMYFGEGMKEHEIAKELDISQSTVSYIINKFPECKKLKEQKKERNKEKHAKKTIEYIYQKRSEDSLMNRSNREEEKMLVANMQRLQEQTARSMSRKGKINSNQMVEINLQHYDLSANKKKLIFNERCGACPADLPKQISVNIYKNTNLKTYEKSVEAKIGI